MNSYFTDGSWAFASTGAIEALLKIHTGILVELSPQQLLDCADTCFECGGGNAAAAFEYVMANGICTEKDYPWVGYKRKCQTKNKVIY